MMFLFIIKYNVFMGTYESVYVHLFFVSKEMIKSMK